MAHVELMPGIASISGKLGNMIFKTRKGVDGKSKVTMHLAGHYDKKAKQWVNNYERSTPLTENEQRARSLFQRRQAEVNRRTRELKEQYQQALAEGTNKQIKWKTKQQIWDEVKKEITE